MWTLYILTRVRMLRSFPCHILLVKLYLCRLCSSVSFMWFFLANHSYLCTTLSKWWSLCGPGHMQLPWWMDWWPLWRRYTNCREHHQHTEVYYIYCVQRSVIHLVPMACVVMESVIVPGSGKENVVIFVSLCGTYMWNHDVKCLLYTATCNPECEHGNCIAPNHCVCDYGWEGRYCDTGDAHS